MRQILFLLAVAASLALMGIPTTQAATPTTQTYTEAYGAFDDTQKEYVQQYTGSFGSVSSESCSNGASTTSAVKNLEPGSRYYLVMGTTGASTITVNSAGDGPLYSFNSATPSTITVLDPDWEPTLIWSETGPSTTGNAFVHVAVPIGSTAQAVSYTCTGTATKNTVNTWANLRHAGYYEVFKTGVAATNHGMVINSTLAQGSEHGATMSQIRWDNFNTTSTCAGPYTGTPTTRTFHRNLTPADGGKATYLAVQEFMNTTGNGYDYSLTSTVGGPALSTEDAFSTAGTPPYRVTLWRLWYLDSYWNTSLTNAVTLNVANLGSGNSLKFCYFEGNNGARLTGQPDSPLIDSFDPFSSSAAFLDVWATNDYNNSVQVTVKGCQQTYILPIAPYCINIYDAGVLANAEVSATLDGVQIASGTTGNDGTFNFNSQSIGRGKTVLINASKSGYAAGSWQFTTPPASAGSYSETVWLREHAAGEGTLTPPLEVACLPSPGNFTVPAAANFTCTKNIPGEVFYSIGKRLGNGNVILTTAANKLTGFNGSSTYYITYPSLGYTVANDAGSYVLVFSNSSAGILTTVPFRICATVSTCPSYINAVDSITLGQITSQLIAATQAALDKSEEAPITTAASIVRTATAFAFHTWILIPNMWLILLIMVVIGLVLAGANRRK